MRRLMPAGRGAGPARKAPGRCCCTHGQWCSPDSGRCSPDSGRFGPGEGKAWGRCYPSAGGQVCTVHTARLPLLSSCRMAVSPTYQRAHVVYFLKSLIEF